MGEEAARDGGRPAAGLDEDTRDSKKEKKRKKKKKVSSSESESDESEDERRRRKEKKKNKKRSRSRSVERRRRGRSEEAVVLIPTEERWRRQQGMAEDLLLGWMKTQEMARKKKRGRKRRKFLQARVKAKIVKMKEGAEKRRRRDLGPGLWKDEEEVEVKRQEEKRI